MRLALLGGEGLRSQSAPLWQAMVEMSSVTHPEIAVIPVALSTLPLSQFERRTQITCKQLGEFGFATTLFSPDADSQPLNSTGLVYLPGGDQRAVVQSLQNSALWSEIISPTSHVKALIASGGSAVAFGDRIFAPTKPYPAALDDLEFEISPGLGLLPNIVILPYFSWLQDAVITKIRDLAPTSVLLGIDDQAALISDPHGWHVMGLGIIAIYRPNQATAYFDPGAQIPPDILTPYP